MPRPVNSSNYPLLYSEDLLMMSPGDVLEYQKMKREKYLQMHKTPITKGQGKDTRWMTRLPDPTKSDGRRTIRKQTKEEVENAVIRYYMEQESEERTAKLDRNITVSDCFQKWVEYSSQRPKIASETLRKYRNDYKRFILNSDFGNMLVRRVDFVDIEEYLIEEVKTKNLKKKALGNLSGYLREMFKYAIRKRIIAANANPCDQVDMKNIRPYCDTSCKPSAERVLSDDEITSLLTALHKHQEAYPSYMPDYAIEICLYTGLRVGEVVALRWDCIRNGELHITQSEHLVIHKDNSSSYELGPTKNAKERRIPISTELELLLGRIRQVQMENGVVSDFIIANANGRLIAQVISNAMQRRGKDAGIKAKSIHAIRRTVSSRLNARLPRATVALIMGHTEEVNESNYDYDTMERNLKKQVMDSIVTKSASEQVSPSVSK